jgi:TolB-like protein
MGDNLPARLTTPFHLAELRVDPASLRIAGPFGTRRLEPRVMDVLVALAARAPEPVSRDALIDAVWGNVVVTDSVLSRCISILREQLGDDRAAPRFIETLSKKGYRLVPPVTFVEDQVATRETPEAVAPPATKPISIAVLPFVNLAADATDEHLADGLTELMIANLAGIAALRVIARTSSMVYKHARKRVRDIAAELDVDYVVEGSVRHEGSRMQVVAQLIEARGEAHAWAHTYTRELRDLLTLLNEIARSVAKAVSARLMPAEAARLARRVAARQRCSATSRAASSGRSAVRMRCRRPATNSPRARGRRRILHPRTAASPTARSCSPCMGSRRRCVPPTSPATTTRVRSRSTPTAPRCKPRRGRSACSSTGSSTKPSGPSCARSRSIRATPPHTSRTATC